MRTALPGMNIKPSDGGHHDHLICTQCGEIIEFENERIEALQEDVARKNGFRVQSHKLEIYGICSDCQEKRTSRKLTCVKERLFECMIMVPMTGSAYRDSSLQKVLLIGNPNVGKSALFGLLTGKYVTVSNYPGTTVEVTYGNAVLNKTRTLVIDTPGVNSLVPMSEDEKVTRDILLTDRAGVVVQVADTKNLRRGLLITLQLAEMEVPVHPRSQYG